MARDSVTTQKITRAGLTPALTAVSANNDVIDAGSVFLQVANGSGSSINVTVNSPVTVDGLTVGPLVVAVGAGATKLIGPFPVATFARPSSSGTDVGRVYVDYSATTSITRAVVSF
ncbi:hypothetical protein GCM10009804_03160 [Kribbella hippodromi]|uniref:Uncharacterized protein n=1 Tax=Kribbella hippodromi TaxID=434347 RepID=A0ABN2BZ11_9ACTN